MRTFAFECPLVQGMHARFASHIEAVCSGFVSTISWRNLRNERAANAKSVISLLASDTQSGDPIEVAINGADESMAHRVLERFVRSTLPRLDARLADLGNSQPLCRVLSEWDPPRVRGTPASGGIAIGQLVLLGRAPLLLPDPDDAPDPEQARRRLTEALAVAEAGIRARLAIETGTAARVLEAHLAICRDIQFRAILLDGGAATAARAILAAAEHFRQLFGASSSPYLRERELDTQDICRRLLRALGGRDSEEGEHLSVNGIAWAEELTPTEFLALDRTRVKALVLGRGGTNSHTIILARSFGLPTLVGVTREALVEHVGREVIVDADSGLIFPAPDARVRRHYDDEQVLRSARAERRAALVAAEARTADQRRIEVAVNIAEAGEAEPGFRAGGEAIGLFRTEMMWLHLADVPGEAEQFEAYRLVAQAAAGRPVIIRTFDFGGDKPFDGSPVEDNPLLGYRGVRLYPEREEGFRVQVRAILRASAFGSVRMMLPMIRDASEIQWSRRIVGEERARLENEGVAMAPTLPIGIMVEVPSAALLVDQLVACADFLSIGSNDLTQYVLAVDRGNARVGRFYDGLHPAVLRLIDWVVTHAHERGRWVGLCGELAADPQALPVLVGLGLDEISVALPAISDVKTRLHDLDAAACRGLVDKALACDTADDVRSLVDVSPPVFRRRPLLAAEQVWLDMPWDGKTEAVAGLADRLWLLGAVDDRREFENAVWARESVYSTGLGFGFAIPHTRTKWVRWPLIGVARLRRPINWQSVDGYPVDMILLLALDDTQADTDHMRFLSRIARRIMHGDFRESLRDAENAAAVVEMLADIAVDK